MIQRERESMLLMKLLGATCVTMLEKWYSIIIYRAIDWVRSMGRWIGGA
jgi:hypothetical protein